MSTLTAAPLDRLFSEADAARSPAIEAMSRQERERLMRSKTEYLGFYGRLKDAWLPVSRQTGALLYALARGSGARIIVEFGTSFGLSTLHLAAALRDNGCGRLITSEFEPSKVARAREHLAEGGLADLVEVREGDALETFAANLPDRVDLLLLDGAKALYPEILDLVAPRLRSGGFVIADDAAMNPDYLARVRSPNGGYLSTPVGDDVELSVRLN